MAVDGGRGRRCSLSHVGGVSMPFQECNGILVTFGYLAL